LLRIDRLSLQPIDGDGRADDNRASPPQPTQR
jgi:hypothetical protein